jgi:hypothetical protein
VDWALERQADDLLDVGGDFFQRDAALVGYRQVSARKAFFAKGPTSRLVGDVILDYAWRG